MELLPLKLYLFINPLQRTPKFIPTPGYKGARGGGGGGVRARAETSPNLVSILAAILWRVQAVPSVQLLQSV